MSASPRHRASGSELEYWNGARCDRMVVTYKFLKPYVIKLLLNSFSAEHDSLLDRSF